MAVDLICSCGENLGKDTENPKDAYCGNCGESLDNSDRGYDDEEDNYAGDALPQKNESR